MNIIEDKNYLKTTDDIESYFKEYGYKYFECGQGYSKDKATVTVKIDQLYYKVEMEAEIGSARQDTRGEKLYWVEDIESVTYTEVSKSSVFRKIMHEKYSAWERAKNAFEKAEVELDKAEKDLLDCNAMAAKHGKR